MPHSRRLACLIISFLVCLYQPAISSSENLATRVFVVDVPIQEWLDDYLGWAHRHPEILHPSGPARTPQQNTRSNEPLMLKMPYLELYSSSGSSLYRGTGAKHNAEFLHKLQSQMPSGPVPTDDLRPTLREYTSMIAQLRVYQAELRSKNEPTILAVTFPDKPFCQAQNAAMKPWEKQSRIRVVEIRLHS